jgi:hypothetical protein
MGTPIYISVFGSFSKFTGEYGAMLASSPEMDGNGTLKSQLTYLKTELENIIKSASVDKSLPSIFCYRRAIAGEIYWVVFRGQDDFTNFPEQNRSYDRKEFFMVKLSECDNPLLLLDALPPMQQYEVKMLGQLPEPILKPIQFEFDEKLFRYFLGHWLQGKSMAMNVNAGTAKSMKDKILGTLNRLPAIYKNYLSVGFNVNGSADAIKNHAHLWSSYSEGEVWSGNNYAEDTDAIVPEFMIALQSGRLAYNDEEIAADKPGRDLLFKLLKVHQIHFVSDNYVKITLTEKQKNAYLQDSRKYLETALASGTTPSAYVVSRIISIGAAWQHLFSGDANIQTAFWTLCAKDRNLIAKLYQQINPKPHLLGCLQKANINTFGDLIDATKALSVVHVPEKEVQTLQDMVISAYVEAGNFTTLKDAESAEMYFKQKNIRISKVVYAKVDFEKELTGLTADNAWSLLRKYPTSISAHLWADILGKIGIENAISQVTSDSDKLLLSNAIWLNQVEHFQSQKHRELLAAADLKKINQYIDFLQKNLQKVNIGSVKQLVGELQTTSISKGVEFYRILFRLAEIIGDKITMTPVEIPENEFFETVVFLDSNRGKIKNVEFVEKLIADFKNQFQKTAVSVTQILELTYNKPDFVMRRMDFFAPQLLACLKRQDAKANVESLRQILEYSLHHKINLYCASGSPIHSFLKETIECDVPFAMNYFRIGREIERSNVKEGASLTDLIDHIINRNIVPELEKIKGIKRMKNIIVFVRRKVKWYLYGSLFVNVLLLSVCGYLLFSNIQLNGALSTVNQRVDSLTKVISAKVESEKGTTSPQNGTVKQIKSSEIKGLKLSEFKNKNIKELIKKIFSLNADIKKRYEPKESDFIKEIKKLNPTCFEGDVLKNCSEIRIPNG